MLRYYQAGGCGYVSLGAKRFSLRTSRWGGEVRGWGDGEGFRGINIEELSADRNFAKVFLWYGKKLLQDF